MGRRHLVSALTAVMVLSVLMPGATLAAAPPLRATTVQTGLVIPWDLGFTPDRRMIVTERPGRVRIYASGKPNAALLSTTTVSNVRAVGEAGVMGLAVDRSFASNRLIYVCASRTYNGQWLNQVLRYKVRDNWTLQFDRYLVKTGMRANTIHNGCAVEQGPDSKIWVTMGDANEPWRAQHPNRLNGKVLRMNRDGSIPVDNPVMPGATKRTIIYSMGHRNPQGLAFEPDTNRLYAIEHGPDRDDEINRIRAGKNYGWPCVTGHNRSYLPGTQGCAGKTFVRPVWSTSGPTIAVSNGVFVKRESKWQGWTDNLMVSTLKHRDIRRFTIDSDGSPARLRATLYDGKWGRLRATVLGPYFELYVTTSNGSGDRIIRIAPQS